MRPFLLLVMFYNNTQEDESFLEMISIIEQKDGTLTTAAESVDYYITYVNNQLIVRVIGNRLTSKPIIIRLMVRYLVKSLVQLDMKNSLITCLACCSCPGIFFR